MQHPLRILGQRKQSAVQTALQPLAQLVRPAIIRTHQQSRYSTQAIQARVDRLGFRLRQRQVFRKAASPAVSANIVNV